MSADKLYTSPDLAKSFKVPKQYMQDLLARMVRAGDVERIRNDDRTFAYSKVIKRTPIDLNTTIAGAPYPPDLKSTMRGYDSQFRTRMQLAMMGRGR
jgi:hypothetical protein